MDLLQIITGLLCVGTIVYLVYQIKELYHAFQDSDDFKDFLANNEYHKERLLKKCHELTDRNSKLIKENQKLEDENRKLKEKLTEAYDQLADAYEQFMTDGHA
tara:strand:- start:13550 stop:13858 length:309 start_codon:yes stop_codon:yes gene_type:complete